MSKILFHWIELTMQSAFATVSTIMVAIVGAIVGVIVDSIDF